MLSLGKKTPVQSLSVRLDSKIYSVPFYQVEQKESSQHILITAGIDGDEYAGIEAAYFLIDHFRKQPPSLSITILPLINIPGFYNGTSHNPLDGKYPKHIFPGSERGSASEQLLYFVSTFLKKNTLWIDLHSGASTETLTPFIWATQTKNREIDRVSEDLLSHVETPLLVYDKYPTKKVSTLAKRGIPYLLLESGQRGEREAKAIRQHVAWVESLIETFKNRQSTQKTKTVYTTVNEYVANHQGLWTSYKKVGDSVEKGQLLGVISNTEKKILQRIQARNSGILLWQRAALATNKQDILIGIATEQQLFTPKKR